MRTPLSGLLGLVCLLFALLTAHAQTPTISGTLSVSLTGDANANNQANEGDQLSYTAVITNSGSGSATGVNLTLPAPPNTTLVTGSLRTSTLARPDAYTTLISGSLSGNSVLANDFGLPTKTVLSFGPSGNPASVGANGTDSSPTDQGGTVVMNPDGTFTYTPSGSFVGHDRFGYTATTTTPPTDAATVTIGVGTPVTALPNAYTITGNVTNTQAAPGLLGNDLGDQPVVSAVNGSTANVGIAVTTTQSGTVTVAPDGSFVYAPRAGYEGPDSFTYSANNGLNLPSTATVTLTITGMIWFIDASVASDGTGTLAKPFKNLGTFASVNNGSGNNPAAGDNIFLYSGSYVTSLTLLTGQKLIGQGATASLASVAGITPAPGSAALPATGGTAPTLSSASANVVTLSQNNLLRGLALGNSSVVSLTGVSFGTLTVSETSINTTQAALGLINGTLTGSFSSITSTGGAYNLILASVGGSLSINAGSLSGATTIAFLVSSGTVSVTYSGNISQANTAPMVFVQLGHSGTLTFQTGTLNGPGLSFSNADGIYHFNGAVTLNGGDTGVDIFNGSGGTFSFLNTTITNPIGVAFNVNGSTANITYNGSIRKDNNATSAVTINAKTGGTTTFGGSITAITTTANAIDLTSNTGSTVNFNGGNLAITTSSGVGFNATGGGTVNVTGTGNTITSPTGTALNVTNTTIGASGLTFQSISSANAATANGINLINTGPKGLTITGTGAVASGGTIANKNGADGSSSSQGTGIYLSNCSNISLNRMNIQGCQNYGIRGITVSGFTLTNSTVGTTTKNGTSVSVDVDASTSVGGEGSMRFLNLTGTASVANCSFDNGFSRTIFIHNDVSSPLNSTFTSCTLNESLNNSNGGDPNGGTSDAIFMQGSSNANMNLTLTGCTTTAYRQFGLLTDARNTTHMDITVANCSFSNGNTGHAGASCAMNFAGSGEVATSGDIFVKFYVHDCTMRHGTGNSAPINGGAQIVSGIVSGKGTFFGKITNNTIGVSGIPFSGAGNAADALRLFQSGSNGANGSTRYLVQGNTIQRYGEVGIQINSRQSGVSSSNGPGSIDATVLNNIIREPGAAAQGAFGAIWVNAGALSADQNSVNIAIGGTTAADKNTMQDSDPSNATDVFLDKNSCGGCPSSITLYKNGSTASGSGEALIRQILVDDNVPSLDLLNGFTNGSTINVASGLPLQPN